MLFQSIAEYLWPKIKFACEVVAAFICFVIMIFGLNIFAALTATL